MEKGLFSPLIKLCYFLIDPLVTDRLFC